MAATLGHYEAKNKNKYPTITLKGDGPKPDKFGLTMGLSKCKLVLAHLEEIRAFVESDPKPILAVPEAEVEV